VKANNYFLNQHH